MFDVTKSVAKLELFGSELNQYPSQTDFYRISATELKIAAKSVATALNMAGGPNCVILLAPLWTF